MNTTTHHCDWIPEAKAQSLDGWHPIETAPKDRTSILVFEKDCEPYVAHWSIFGCCWIPSTEQIAINGNATFKYHSVDKNITHWMPLPQPPKDQQ